MKDKKESFIQTKEYIKSKLEEEISRAKRNKQPIAVLIFDINYDFFEKEYNIKWALHYSIIKQLEVILKKVLRELDKAGKWSGETFTAIFPETNLEGAFKAAERMREAVSNHEFLGDAKKERVKVALNIGVAVYPINGINSDELFTSAHGAFIKAVDRGGNCTVVSDRILHKE
jgi:diguanylate cyclase (GGDEF)-like protein